MVWVLLESRVQAYNFTSKLTTVDAAQNHVLETLKHFVPGMVVMDPWPEDIQEGLSVTNIHEWSFSKPSFWRSPKNVNVYKLAKSMAVSGFRKELHE